MAAKFFTGLPLDGPDPECVNGHGEALLAGVGAGATPRPAMDHSRRAAAVQPGHVRPPLTAASIRVSEDGGCDEAARAARARPADGAQPRPVRPARHQPRRRRPALHRPPRRLLRAPGRAAGAGRSSSRGPASTTPTGRTSGPRWPAVAAAGWARDRRRLPTARRARHRLARPRRRQGSSAYSQRPLWAPSRVPEVATREVPKWMEADDIAAVVAGFGAAAGGRGRRRLRRRRDQRRPAQPGAPVPVRADEPARRRVGRRPPALRPRGDRRRACGRRRRTRCVGLRLSCDELAPWAGITPDMAAGDRRRAGGAAASTTSSSCAARSSRSSRPAPTSTSRPGSTSSWPARSAAAVDVPVFLQGSIVDAPARPSGRSAATTTRPAAPASR